jgi:hypothetical protein
MARARSLPDFRPFVVTRPSPFGVGMNFHSGVSVMLPILWNVFDFANGFAIDGAHGTTCTKRASPTRAYER